MGYVEVFVALICASCVGYLVVKPLGRILSPIERVPWAAAVGLLLLVLSCVGLIALHLYPGPWKLLAIGIGLMTVSVATAALTGRLSLSEAATAAHRRHNLSGVVWLLVTLPCLFFAAEATRSPMWTTDHIAVWGLKARTVFTTASIPNRLFHDPALAWSHPEYPLFLPLSMAAIAFAIREWNSPALAILYPFFELLTILTVGGFLARRISLRAGAAGGILVGLCSTLYSGGNVGTADIPLAFALTLVGTSVLDALDYEDRASLWRVAIAALLATATKGEGTLFSLLLGATILLRKAPSIRRRFGVFMSLSAPVLLHAVAMRASRGRVIGRDSDWTLLSIRRFPDLVNQAEQVAARIFAVELRDALVPLVCIIAILLVTRRSAADVLLWPLTLQILAYVGVCAFSSYSPTWQVASALPRVTITLMPLGAIVAICRVFGAMQNNPAGTTLATESTLHAAEVE